MVNIYIYIHIVQNDRFGLHLPQLTVIDLIQKPDEVTVNFVPFIYMVCKFLMYIESVPNFACRTIQMQI